MTTQKRLFDVLLGCLVALPLAPVFLIVSLAIWAYDRESPFYTACRVGLNGAPFRMIKFRSMVVGADKSGVASTAGDDRRITPIGRIARRFKLDEIPQIINILMGQMSFVGPRPNVRKEVELYSETELDLLSVRPGVTDFASIVFSDESEILSGADDPERRYNLLIRPWKSRLGLHYVHVQSVPLDVVIMVTTVIAVFSRPRALRIVARLLRWTHASPELIAVARRDADLRPTRPPGVSREGWEEHLTYR